MPLMSVVVDRHELLYTAAGDRFGNVDVALRIDSSRVSECKVTRIMSGARNDPADTEGSEHSRRCLVEQPSVVVAEIDVNHHVLTCRAVSPKSVDIGPEVDVVASSAGKLDGRGGRWRGNAVERIVADRARWRGNARSEPNVDYFHRRAHRLTATY